MQKSVVFFCALSLMAAALWPEAQEKYISPNDDGVQDVLSFPLKITDKRYVASWSLVIKDESGKVVRTIGNKESLPTSFKWKELLEHIKDKKKDADVPAMAVWNGRLEGGETAPDGKYTYYVTATDDRGNTSTTKEYTVIVDNTPPEAEVKGIADKVFGAGEKTHLHIAQSGTSEDEWRARITDASGNAVKHYSWKGVPESIDWDGTDDRGFPVQDGVYSYSITATDRAGNVSPRAGLTNIIFSADKSVTAVAIKGSRYFSPGTESKQQTVSFDVTIPVPNAKSANRLVQWEVSVVDEGKKTLRKWAGKNNPITSLVFDGKDEKSGILPDGKYRVRVVAKYLNGYEPPVVYSPQFVLDTSKPRARLAISEKVFGAGEKTAVKITPAVEDKPLAKVRDWRGRVETPDGKVVREWDEGEWPQAVLWDGSWEGAMAEDGEYVFRLYGTDEAGNYGEAVSGTFVLDTTEAAITLLAEREAFSPGGNTPVMPFVAATYAGAGGIARYTFSIMDDGVAVHTVQGEGTPPKRFEWDGMGDAGQCPDGEYTARLEAEGANTSKAAAYSMPFLLDTRPPYAKACLLVKAFAPGFEGAQKTAPVSVEDCTAERLWTAEVKARDGDVVKRFSWSGKVHGFEWDGTDASGNVARDGDYAITISSTDEAMNTFSETLPPVTLDTRDIKGYITTAHEGISPNGDGYLDEQTFSFSLSVNDSIVSWQADVCDEKGQAVHSWMGGVHGEESVPSQIEWDGFVAGGKANRIAGEGTFNCNLRVVYNTGRVLVVSSRPFVCTATPPILSVEMTPEYFSPDNDGVDDDLFIKLGCVTKARVKTWEFKADDPRGRVFWEARGRGDVTKSLTWDGLSNTQKDANGMAERVQSAVDYPYTFTVSDDLGMTSVATGVIPVDVLVIRDGNVLKMAVPSIIFRPDHADFKVETKPGKRDGVTAEQAKNNEKVLGRVADILGKFKDYKVTVVGHANRTTENEAEETEDNMKLWGPALIPLSEQRAQAVKEYLSRHGVSKNRLDTEGKGGTQPVADWHDKDNNWKNRRVEFILHK